MASHDPSDGARPDGAQPDGGGPGDEPRLRALLGRLTPADHAAAEGPGPCPDAIELARLAEGRAADEERPGLEAHLARCEACRSTVAAISTTVPSPAAVPEPDRIPSPEPLEEAQVPRRPLPRSTWTLLAAVVMVALGLFTVWMAGRDGARAGTEAQLVALATELTREHPDVFGDFRPLSREERLAPPRVQRSSGASLLAPVGVTLDRRPTFRWEAVSDVTSWDLSLSRSDGTELWSARVEGTRLEFPADFESLDEGGAFLWELSGKGTLGRVEGNGLFRVATRERRTRFDNAVRAIDETATGTLRALLIAHVALRWEHLDRAEAALRDAAAAHPPEPVLRETLYCLLGRIGSDERDSFDVTPGGR